MLDYFLILFLSHLLTDFVFQSDAMVACKYGAGKKARMALFYHAGTYFITSLFLFSVIQGMQWFSWPNLIIIMLLSLSHYIVDLLKVNIIKSSYSSSINSAAAATTTYSSSITSFSDSDGTCSCHQVKFGYPFWLFWADQLVHLALVVIFTLAAFHTAINWEGISAEYLINVVLPAIKPFSAMQKILILSCLLIIISSFANIIVKLLLETDKTQISAGSREVIAGRYIGTLERVLTVIAIIGGAYEAVAILFASKTAVRFGQIQSSAEFRDYYISGTLISVLFGILAGILARITLY